MRYRILIIQLSHSILSVCTAKCRQRFHLRSKTARRFLYSELRNKFKKMIVTMHTPLLAEVAGEAEQTTCLQGGKSETQGVYIPLVVNSYSAILHLNFAVRHPYFSVPHCTPPVLRSTGVSLFFPCMSSMSSVQEVNLRHQNREQSLKIRSF